MFGFLPISGAPISSIGITPSSVIELSISEDILYVDEDISYAASLVASISEGIVVEDTRSYLYGVTIIENVSVREAYTSGNNYVVTVSEYVILTDNPVPAASYSLTRTEGLTIRAIGYELKGWDPVKDVNVAAWGDVANTNQAFWNDINDMQESSWEPIDTTKLN
jgi:hypothetical protein